MGQPLVSVCIANLNKRKYLPACIESVLGQTLSDWELICSDNYSDDGSWEYLQNVADDPRITVFQSDRRGMYDNFNRCLKRVKGKYTYIMGSDDVCAPT